MALSPSELRLYARHLLLAEIGPEGQARLCEATLRLPAGVSGVASRVAGRYLERAGVRLGEEGDEVRSLPSPEAVVRLAGDPRLVEAAASLAGALAAVESVKTLVGAGRPAPNADDLVLAGPAE